ncbi:MULTISPECIES: YwqH-like family protein [Ureibacillus]|uniref:YwqH-like family protein n=1 Tax=Ureibacillus TaxID=160795 RepID=UPI0030C9B435
MSLSYVNSQIQYYNHLISLTNVSIGNKEEKIQRLKNVKSELLDIKGEFSNYERRTKEPEFTSTTWHGKLATEFHSFRLGDLVSNYRYLYQNQLSDIVSKIETKINDLNQQIQNLKEDINKYENRRSDLYNLRTKLKNEGGMN